MHRIKHATIMFTDIVGYMPLLESDRDNALRMLHKNQKIHKNIIGKHHGKLIKEIEDGVLASFDLASDAIRCSAEIQRKAMVNDISLRIGIDEGEMIFEGTEVVGDGVDIALRLQEISNEGCITISEAIYNNLKNKKGFSAVYIGEEELKNEAEPIKVYRVKCYRAGEPHKQKETVKRKKRHVIPYIVIILLLIILIITFLWSWFSLPSWDPGQNDQEDNKTLRMDRVLLNR